MRKPDLTPLLPLGLPAGSVWRVWAWGLGLAGLPSLQFLAAYSRARGDLFEYNRLTGVRSLISGAKILPFPQLPRRRELWRRVLTVPLLASLSALAAAGLVTALFAAIYWGCTPAAAL